MTADELKQRFPRASQAFIAANLAARVELHSAQPCEQAPPLAADCKRKTSGGRCPVVRFTIRRKKLLDVDAKFGAIKHLLDGIVATGIVAGDKEGQITLEVLQEQAGKNETEQTIIEIYENI